MCNGSLVLIRIGNLILIGLHSFDVWLTWR
jgi:hypothetical protein